MRLPEAPIRSHHIAGICLASILSLATATAREAAVLDMAAFGAKADGIDTTPSVRAALSEIRNGKAKKLVFPPGRYEFHPAPEAGEWKPFNITDSDNVKVEDPATVSAIPSN